MTGRLPLHRYLAAAIHLVSSGAIDLDALVTGRYDLEHVADALDSDTDPASLKSIVIPNA